jgi:hypothetical protein
LITHISNPYCARRALYQPILKAIDFAPLYSASNPLNKHF